MWKIKRVMIRSYEVGLYFCNGEFKSVMRPGKHWVLDLPGRRAQVEIVSQRNVAFVHDKLDMIVKSGALADLAIVADLQDHERGVVWVDGRFSHLLRPGLHAFWTGQKRVKVESIDARQIQFQHDSLAVIARSAAAKQLLDVCEVRRDHAGALFVDGKYISTLTPGTYAFWLGMADVRVVETDLRETAVDIGGQEIMTADKVTLRLNALVNYKVIDERKAISSTDDVRQALYREAQLALRAVVGVRELDVLLADKDGVAEELQQSLRLRSAALGLEIASVGIRDVILPGEMKDLLNRVTEAKKAAEANLISRREETAAMRSQANTARLLAENPTLMRLRELEVLERVATAGHFKVVLGEKGLTERVVNLL